MFCSPRITETPDAPFSLSRKSKSIRKLLGSVVTDRFGLVETTALLFNTALITTTFDQNMSLQSGSALYRKSVTEWELYEP